RHQRRYAGLPPIPRRRRRRERGQRDDALSARRPDGRRQDPNGTAGTCGEPCTSFCSIAAKNCASVFPDMATCMTACKSFKPDMASYSTADTATNDMGCRFYHLSVASEGGAMATMHCPHIVAMSAVCVM